jgi:hypothetical protein
MAGEPSDKRIPRSDAAGDTVGDARRDTASDATIDAGSALRSEAGSAGSDLDAALRSPVARLPENAPKGWLGEVNPDLRRPDTFEPDLNAGLSQENDTPVKWLAIILGFLLFFVPGLVLLWRSRWITVRTKIVTSLIAAAVTVGLVLAVSVRH